MSKELQALEDIVLYLNANEPKGLYCKNIEVIKTALKSCEIDCKDYKLEEALVNLERHSKRYKGRKEDLNTLFNVVKGYQYQKKNIASLMKENKALKERPNSYKAIEDDFGINLITLHKALKDGIYWKGTTCVDTKGIFFEDKPKINIVGKCLTNICFRKHLEVVYFKDYGKTWALTEEELL